MMTKTHIYKALSRAGLNPETCEDGIIIRGIKIQHDDSTGLSQIRQAKFKARDCFEFLQNIHYEGIGIESEVFRAVRRIEKEL